MDSIFRNCCKCAILRSDYCTSNGRSICKKRHRKLTKGVHLLHDDAPIHTGAVTKAAIKDSDLKQLQHPPYSPPIGSQRRYLFVDFKNSFRERYFFHTLIFRIRIFRHFYRFRASFSC